MSRNYCSFHNHGMLSFTYFLFLIRVRVWFIHIGKFVLLPFKTYIKFLFKAVVHFLGKYTSWEVTKRVSWIILYVFVGINMATFLLECGFSLHGARPSGILQTRFETHHPPLQSEFLHPEQGGLPPPPSSHPNALIPGSITNTVRFWFH